MADEDTSFMDLEDEPEIEVEDPEVVEDPEKEVEVEDPEKEEDEPEKEAEKVVEDKPPIDTNAAQIAALQAEINALKNKPEPVVEKELPEFIPPTMEEWAENPNLASDKLRARDRLEMEREFDKKLQDSKQEQVGDAEFKKTHETAWTTIAQIDPDLNVANSQKNQLANHLYKQMGLDKVPAGPLLAGATAAYFIGLQANRSETPALSEKEIAEQLEESRQERVKKGSVQSGKKSGLKTKTVTLTPDQRKTARNLNLTDKEMLDALKSDGQMEDK